MNLWVVSSPFNVNVTPGNYAFLCFVEDSDTGAPHFALGMLEEFRIQNSAFSRTKLSLWALHNSDEKPRKNGGFFMVSTKMPVLFSYLRSAIMGPIFANA